MGVKGSPSGTKLAVCLQRSIAVYDVATWSLVHRFQHDTDLQEVIWTVKETEIIAIPKNAGDPIAVYSVSSGDLLTTAKDPAAKDQDHHPRNLGTLLCLSVEEKNTIVLWSPLSRHLVAFRLSLDWR